MTRTKSPQNWVRALSLAALLVALLAAGGAGYWLAASGRSSASRDDETSKTKTAQAKPLYYYDPMFPQQKFDKPGKSPFMDMQLVPKYADALDALGDGKNTEPGFTIDSVTAQNLGIRTAKARIGTIETNFTATGTIAFNERDIAIVQAKAQGFVQRTYRRAPGDIVSAGAPLADILVPDWQGAQAEYLALAKSNNRRFAEQAKARMRLLGMPDDLILRVVRSGKPQRSYTVTAPIGGVIQNLGVRQGMTVSTGQLLAQINGLRSVWLNVAIPEARASEAHAGQQAGQRAIAQIQAFPGAVFSGKIIALLPALEADSRTLTGRIELMNADARLRPGMFASVALSSPASPTVLVPSEAIIATGTRTLVMLASDKGRYRPAEVRIGREGAEQTEILAGLSAGEKIIVSGQFLVDSEASLSGVAVRALESQETKADQETDNKETNSQETRLGS